MRCASCGSQPAADARFCDQCGAPISGMETRGASRTDPDEPFDGDRRIVTALFADLVDYVRMLAEDDPEVVRARVTGALEAMADVVASYGGTREKFIGDAVFAVFGWPRAHDDDAARATSAALAIRARLADLGDGPEPMQVRIGIATGEVVAARASGRPRTGGRHGDLGLTGAAISTAARIQALARPGEVLIDGATLAAARGRVVVDGRGTVVLRGQSVPVVLHEVRGVAGRPAWSPNRGTGTAPLIGRADELGRMRALLDRAVADRHGGIAVVVGEAGVGKTRLLSALEDEARAMGLAWTWVDNVSYGVTEPYRFARAFAQAVADEHGVDSGSLARRLLFTADLPPDEVRRLGGAIAAIARDAAFSGWEAEADHTPSDPAEVGVALMDVAARYLDRLLATSGPRVVVIDDLHWLDPSSVGMVELMAAATRHHPLVLLAGSLPLPLPGWSEGRGVLRVELAGLAAPETAQLATLVARAALDAGDAERLHDRTGGNPLFVAETVRAYLEDGTLTWRDGRVLLTTPRPGPVPLTLRAVLGARIDALDDAERDAIGVAAVVGLTFDPVTVGAILGGEPLDPSILVRLADAALIDAQDDGMWRFAHPLIHETAYAGLLASRRRALHARVADLLAAGQRPVAVGILAAHRAAAGDAARAVPLLRAAADEAMAIGASAEAAAAWRRAADLGADLDPAAAAADRERAASAEALAATAR